MGTRTSTNFAPSGLTDHPHACGDKLSTMYISGRLPGSSPRVWGQEGSLHRQRGRSRIIPTRVGTRYLCQRCLLCLWDHPHACGVKISLSKVYLMHIGSSPRVWGQDQNVLQYQCGQGIIPTRVGTSSITPESATVNRDHPHACGDKHYDLVDFEILDGSSPRVWGQVIILLRRSYRERIIPTRVGTRINGRCRTK